MNISELARQLKVNPQELRDLLPTIGFNIGQKAIKIDNNTAKKIIKNWPVFRHRLEMERAAASAKEREERDLPKEKKPIVIPSTITVRNFSELAGIPVNRVLSELMKNGVFASINEKIDFDTAVIIGAGLNLEIQPEEKTDLVDEVSEEKKLQEIIDQEEEGDLESRPPVVVVMGHVDHGKTKLLDSIRLTDVASEEAGGITQHIGAYQIKRQGRKMTFIDTPGHEAFTAMRSRGAKVADIAILVVAADDGVKPQTVEACRIIEAAKIPFLVAINKMDKPEANLDKTKQELSSVLGITPEDWGGKTICVPISAKEGTGIEELLDVVLLLAETESQNMKANPSALAAGTVIESNVDKGAGPVATILVQNGTLRIGDQLCFNEIIYGKVKSLKNHLGEEVTEAGPSVPVKILGLKISPEIGDILEVGDGIRVKNKKIRTASGQTVKSAMSMASSETDDDVPQINLIIKADFLGSAEAIEESLMKLNTEKVRVKILAKGLGNITEGDVRRAEDSNAEIVGFNVRLTAPIENLVREKGVPIKIYSVIYDLIKDMREKMKKMIKVEMKRVDEGRIKVLAIFRTENNSQIIGGRVLDGYVRSGSSVDIKRAGEIVATRKIAQLQSGKLDVKEIQTNDECGLLFEGQPIIKEGDILEAYHEEEIKD
ncbi:MAG: translation initiation factor IF-2 [Patescibacteria group bacterium]|jgi:translation initiation factor IF-2